MSLVYEIWFLCYIALKKYHVIWIQIKTSYGRCPIELNGLDCYPRNYEQSWYELRFLSKLSFHLFLWSIFKVTLFSLYHVIGLWNLILALHSKYNLKSRKRREGEGEEVRKEEKLVYSGKEKEQRETKWENLSHNFHPIFSYLLQPVWWLDLHICSINFDRPLLLYQLLLLLNQSPHSLDWPRLASLITGLPPYSINLRLSWSISVHFCSSHPVPGGRVSGQNYWALFSLLRYTKGRKPVCLEIWILLWNHFLVGK